jgi:hypothetical protein
MRQGRVAATIAAVAIVSGCGVAHHGVAAITHPAAPAGASSIASSPPATSPPATSAPATSLPATSLPATSPPPAADPATVWLESPGGQAQVTFNDDVDNLAGALETENLSSTIANHLVFEAAARIVRTEARKILATRALLPTVNQAAYERMLNDFITVANLLQPGPGYGTETQDNTAWYAALRASNITVT